MASIGKRIKELRDERGLTQTELADLLGVSQKTISSWEVDRTEPKMGMIEKVCAVLNCKKTDIIVEPLWELAKDVTARAAAEPVFEKYLQLSIENQLTVQILIDALLTEQKKREMDSLSG